MNNNRYIRCQFVVSNKNNKRFIPLWELDVDEDNNEFIYKESYEKFLREDIREGYFDLVSKNVVIGKLIEIFDNDYEKKYKIGDKVLVEVGIDEMTIKEISNIKVNYNRYSLYFVNTEREVGELLNNKENYKETILNPDLIPTSIIEIRVYYDNIYEFTDGTEIIYDYKLKKLI